MKLDEVVGWYQKKIGTYDKQQWEKTVEQKILDGFGSSVTLKNAKLKTELIDVDLVRGSTFPKAKPKQTLITVIRLAILRYLFLPLYAQWWVKQTSPNIFALLFLLYITQMINWAIYTFNFNRIAASIQYQNITEDAPENMTNFGGDAETPTYAANNKQTEDTIVSITELFIPMVLSLLISLIHSQIVATNSTASSNKNKHRRFSNTNAGAKSAREQRPRRRKKFVRIRQPELLDNVHMANSSTKLQKRQPVNANSNSGGSAGSGVETLSKSLNISDTPNNIIASTPKHATPTIVKSTESEEIFLSTTAITPLTPLSIEKTTTTKKPTLDLKNATATDNLTDNQLKKRNVNWHTPLHNYATETFEKEQQTSPQTTSIATQSSTFSSSSSSAQTSKSSSETTTPNNNDVCEMPRSSKRTEEQQLVQVEVEIPQPVVEDLSGGLLRPANAYNTRRNIGEDDGFESLNGKSSSGEDTHSPMPANNSNPIGSGVANPNANLENVQPNQIRLRLNVGGIEKKSQPRGTHSSSSDDTDEEGEDADIISSPASACNNECTTSATEWLGITTNSEDCCSYSSELEQSDSYKNHAITDEEGGCELDFTPATILTPHGSSDRISCTIWDHREIKKAQMSVLEISSCIIERVESMPETNDYIYIGLCFSLLLSLIPTFCRLCEATLDSDKTNEVSYFELPMLLWEKASFSFYTILSFAFGGTQWERSVLIIAFIQRLCLTLILFIIFAVAERTFKQRFLYAKLFSHLTSSRRARKSNLPHFRLNKVRNIKTWLSVRSYLKKRGPQRSVDIIVSAAFIVTLLLLAFLSVEWLKDSVQLHSHLNLEALMWSITIGIFLLRFMTLGNKIHHKYRSVSVLITEQINLYLQIEQKPKKKDELMVSNSVLKLAADLLKELETPFKISGLSANPYLFTTIKVVILSALSGVLSEVLGFKLKLHKIKIK